MKIETLNRFQYLPILALTICLAIGGYLYNRSFDNWLTHIVSDYMFSLMEDVSFQIEDQHLDLYEMSEREIDAFLDTLSRSSSGRRFTIIHQSGKVLGDSQLTARDLHHLDNHSNRAEIIEALAVGVGVQQRYSSTMGQEMLYVAKRLNLVDLGIDHDELYVLRLAMPMTALYSMAKELQVIVITLMGVSLCLFIGFSWFSNHYIIRVISRERENQEKKIQQRTREIELLQRLANMLAACNSLEEAQDVVADIVPRILGNVNGCVSIMRESRNQLEVKLDWGGKWPGQKVYSPSDCWALRKGKPHMSHDEHHTLPCSHMSESTLDGQTLCVPLTAHGNTVGMFHLYYPQTHEIDLTTQQLAYTIAEHLGLALANLGLQQKLRAQALTDPLTGLFNRRYFEDSIDKAWTESKAKQQPFSLLMLDLDHFKRFNDNFGHEAGDFVLKEVSRLLTQISPDKASVCRLGGEELAIVIPESDALPALEFANKIVEEIKHLHLELKGTSLGQLGISIGVSTYPLLALEPEGLVNAADTALYAAKEQGRSRAIHFEDTQKKAEKSAEFSI